MTMREQQSLEQMLRGSAATLKRQVAGSAVGGADAEERLAQGLQAASFNMEKLASIQKLNEEAAEVYTLNPQPVSLNCKP